MKEQYPIANAMDGFSKAIYANREEGVSCLVLSIEVLYNSMIPDAVLDQIQDSMNEIFLKAEALMRDP